MRSLDVNVKGESESSYDTLEESYISTGPNTGGFDIRNYRRTTLNSKCYYFGMLDVNSTAAGDFKTSFGLTMDNWIPSIWELIPWSFAIDYFTGMGDFISSICFPWQNFRYIGRTRMTTNSSSFYGERNLTEDVSTDTGTTEYRFTPGKGRVSTVAIIREPVTQVIAIPELRVPGYKEAYFNLGALALLRSSNKL
jgi:hypothetical protein